MAKFLTFAFLVFVLLTYSVPQAWAQTTEFTYQGSLKDGANPANGNYDFEFLLFDALTSGTQQGSTLTKTNVAVANGTFAVKLDFGSQFPGANRFLEIHVRPAGGGAFIPLSPRQSVASSPYAVQSLNAANATNATQLGGVAANQYVVTTDPRMTDARDPLPGSTNYIRNTSANVPGDFNLTGVGEADYFSSRGGYQINGNNVLMAQSANTIVGIDAGVNTSGNFNSFFGKSAGLNNTTGSSNAFFGDSAGLANTVGRYNAFFGSNAGIANTTGENNSFFGSGTGTANTTGGTNSFFGATAGRFNTTGLDNSFFGVQAGFANTNGNRNSYFGSGAGVSNQTATDNSFFGYNAGHNTTNAANSFFGAWAGESNTSGGANSFFGYVAGKANSTGYENSFFWR